MNEKQIFQEDVKILQDAILNSPKSAIIAYLNLHKLFRFKPNKTKQQLPTAQFHIPAYEIKARRDRNKYGAVVLLSMLKKVSPVKEFKNLKRSYMNHFVQN